MLYRLLFDLLLRRLDAERVHRATIKVLATLQILPGALWLLRRTLGRPDPVLRSEVFGLPFNSPVGVAAGFDKDAEVYTALLAFGFGFVEVGTITGQGQPGNDPPRLFRLPADRALINRMGFNNSGAEVARNRMAGHRGVGYDGIVGVNIGKTKAVPAEETAGDYVESTRRLAPLADYLVVNVSSPNTPGLRDLQAAESLRPLLQAVLEANATGTPVLVKIAPDLADDDIDAVADLAVELGLAGIIAANTTVSREGLRTTSQVREQAGGLSGPPLAPRAREVLARLHRRVGDRLVLVSVGGIDDVDEAWARITAGASLVQSYTGMIYGGPLWAWRMHTGLAARLRAEGFSNLAEAVGSAA